MAFPFARVESRPPAAFALQQCTGGYFTALAQGFRPCQPLLIGAKFAVVWPPSRPSPV
jgi:hypothetical protein